MSGSCTFGNEFQDDLIDDGVCKVERLPRGARISVQACDDLAETLTAAQIVTKLHQSTHLLHISVADTPG